MSIPPKKRAKKEEAQLLAAVDASTQVPVIGSDTPIIDDVPPKSKGIDKKKTKNRGGLTMSSSVPDLAIKVYEEQIEGGWTEFAKRIASIPVSDYMALAILHNKDTDSDEIYEPAVLKPHAHIDVISNKRDKHGRKERRNVSTILKMLGIVFRPEIDDELWKNRGVERIHDLAKSVAYLTHETKEADLAGKHVYDREEIVSNLSPEEIDQLRAGYMRLSVVAQKADLATQAELAQLAEQAGETGEKSWEEFEELLPITLQKGSAYAFFRRKYAQGMARRFSKTRALVRLSIFIEGPKDLGKTTGARKALESMGLSCYEVSDGGKTGRWDKLTPSHGALLVDDTIINDVLGMADNKVCEVYRRGGENPFFCGSVLVVCSNMSFDEWLKASNVPDRQKEAARSRFYMCRVIEKNGEPALVLDEPSKRGAPDEQKARAVMFTKFARPMVESMREYKAMKREPVDYSILEEFMETEPQQMTIKLPEPKKVDRQGPVWRDPETKKVYRDYWDKDIDHSKRYEVCYYVDGSLVVEGESIPF